MTKRLINRPLAILVVGVLALAGVQGAAFAGEKTCPLRIKGMHCEMCPGKVEAALKSVPGVKSAKVDYKSATADVVVDDSVKPAQLMGAVEKAGFQAEPLTPGATSKASSDPCCH
jgi:Cu+-exporting ATPase